MLATKAKAKTKTANMLHLVVAATAAEPGAHAECLLVFRIK